MSPTCINVPPLPLHRHRLYRLSPSARGAPPRRAHACVSTHAHLGQDGLWLVVSVGEVDALTHVLSAGLGIHHFRENLQTVTVGVEEVDAVGHTVIGGVVHLGAMLEEPAIQLAELRLAALDL